MEGTEGGHAQEAFTRRRNRTAMSNESESATATASRRVLKIQMLWGPWRWEKANGTEGTFASSCLTRAAAPPLLQTGKRCWFQNALHVGHALSRRAKGCWERSC